MSEDETPEFEVPSSFSGRAGDSDPSVASHAAADDSVATNPVGEPSPLSTPDESFEPAGIEASAGPKKASQIGAGLALLAVLAVGAIALSQFGDSEPASDGLPPILGDHWHAAFGVYNCDGYEPDIQSDLDPHGIHTHNDGLIHIHPFSNHATGAKATLGLFGEGLELAERFDTLAAQTTCTIDGDTVPAEFTVSRYSSPDQAEPTEVIPDWRLLRFRGDNEVIILAVAPLGADVPMPASVETLTTLYDEVEPAECNFSFDGDNELDSDNEEDADICGIEFVELDE